MARQIPVIDLQEFERQPHKLREASEKWGCFRLMNHGIPQKLMAEMKQVARDLHDLPLEMKLRNKDSLPESGYTRASENSPLYEGLGLFDAGSSQCISTFCSQLQASARQRETIEVYAQAIHKLALDLATKVAKSMGIASYSFDGWPCQFKINKYVFTQTSIGSLALKKHTDSAFLIVLQDDENLGGLEVADQRGTFVAVDPMPGTLVVNLGDIVVPWSNGRLHSVQHCVQCKNVGIRYSIATSISPPLGNIVEAPPEFVDDKHPRLFSPFTYEEYRKLRASKNMHAGEALELVRAER